MNFFGKGFPSEALVELRADLTRKEDKIHFSSTNRYFSQRSLLRPLILSPKYSRYLTSPDGTIDTSRQGPVSGTYVGTHRFFSFNNIHNAYYTQWPQIISKLKLSDCKELLLDKSHLPQWRSSLVNESRIGFCESSLAIRHQQTPSIHLLFCGQHQVLVITIKLIIVGNIVVTDQTTFTNTSLVIWCHLMIIIT